MKNVAVLGATGNLGEMFVKELVEHKFHVSIICNSARPANVWTSLMIPIYQVLIGRQAEEVGWVQGAWSQDCKC